MNSKRLPTSSFELCQVAVAALLALAGTLPGESVAAEQQKHCISVEHIEGVYHCAGECVLRADDGGTRLVEISDEVDEISRIEGAKAGLYQSSITGAAGFSELEIGALHGKVMRTATARVSDGHFTVLEEYVFEHDASCSATAYTKIVRNPTKAQFKACNIRCEKQP